MNTGNVPSGAKRRGRPPKPKGPQETLGEYHHDDQLKMADEIKSHLIPVHPHKLPLYHNLNPVHSLNYRIQQPNQDLLVKIP